MKEITYNDAAIKSLRESLKLNYERFAERLGITRQNAWELENNDSTPNVKTLVKVMNAFGVEPGFFFNYNITPDKEQEKS